MQPIVAVVCDVRQFDTYTWHATPETYLKAALEVAGVLPLMVPAFGDRIDIAGLLKRVDGVMLSGSKSNVHPGLYGAEPGPDYEPYDPARDATSLPLARAAVETGVPLLAICRGLQELNVALGGTLATEIQQLEGRSDHRAPERETHDERFAIAHDVAPKADGCLAAIVGNGPVPVNSLHRQAISALAPRLQVEAVADDGTVEAVSVIDAPGFALGVQWHPEYWAKSDTPSRRIFEAFGAATRVCAGGRLAAAQ
ncbi:MAG: gamma-glutamyl-gamma-aminobutyrate hydrolase family protein [Roseitalea sp.]|jgi:putative glutamine amidotransferase|nr:gamma-glutamyl-gamma-aminobutyrate hydrolase family protein [Roseitalea sp.]MBO6722417.1 gamma-glutamyl-gamma-aminobutyrate hydrolase family protein [Roseitalea sp.]MBO6741969.1 gamma-glutamyl-gamma-aminobutyrate hydrolase family protein [Roseitalea sp.]